MISVLPHQQQRIQSANKQVSWWILSPFSQIYLRVKLEVLFFFFSRCNCISSFSSQKSKNSTNSHLPSSCASFKQAALLLVHIILRSGDMRNIIGSITGKFLSRAVFLKVLRVSLSLPLTTVLSSVSSCRSTLLVSLSTLLVAQRSSASRNISS